MHDAAAAEAAAADGNPAAAAAADGAAGPAAPGQQQAAGQGEGQSEPQADAAYINIFLLKFVCPREACRGTLAPLAPPAPADVLECNLCGGRRTEAEFLAELEAAE